MDSSARLSGPESGELYRQGRISRGKAAELPGEPLASCYEPHTQIFHVKDAGLGRGETEAIHLALHLRPDRPLPDDGEGRRETRGLGLRVTGALVIIGNMSVGTPGFTRRWCWRTKIDS